MQCADCRSLLDAYLDGELAEGERASVREHLAGCADCSRERAALDRASVRLQALSPRATLARGYAIVRAGDAVLRDAAGVAEGMRIEVELARGALGARVEDVRP